MAAQAAVAVTLQEIIELCLRVVHVKAFVVFLIHLLDLFLRLIVVEVFDVFLVGTAVRSLRAFGYVVLRLIVNHWLLVRLMLALL